LKYFIRGAFASGLLLYGTTLIYGATGSINFGDRQRLRIGGDRVHDKVRGVGRRRVMIARLFKLSAAPFHM
jgi:NADH-quinone oxidoreductase subunit N